MRIAFHAPMKPPDHPTPSGDRLMARQLLAALGAGGHDARVESRLVTRLADPAPAAMARIEDEAAREREALAARYDARGAWRPDLWLTYHLYYKAPDLIGPTVAARLGIPYVAVEASWSPRREAGGHARWAAHATEAMRGADLLISFTARDGEGLRRLPGRRGMLARLDPFLAEAGAEPVRARRPGGPVRLVTVAMMRPGRKAECHHALAEALATLPDRNWTLEAVGDGPARRDIERSFAFAGDRVRFRGALDEPEVRATLDEADIFAWPGLREPFGMAYLEASARGLPIAAFRSGGVESVVRDGETGLLAPEGDQAALAETLGRLIDDEALRDRLGAAGRRFVAMERGLATAAGRLDALLREVMAGRRKRA